MSEFKSFDVEARADAVEQKKLETLRRGKTRDAAVAYGRALGEDESRRRNESEDWAESRIKRAMAYAAWEWDGKPIGGGAKYRKEFGIPEPAVSDPRISLGSDFVTKKER